MCEQCVKPYGAVGSLFNADLNIKSEEHSDREDWVVISPRIIVYLGESALPIEQRPLYRGCDEARQRLDPIDEVLPLVALSRQTKRPVFGSP